MKLLVVYYSRTGTTKRVAEAIARDFKCDVEEIHDSRINRDGVMGWLISGKEACLKKYPEIKEIKNDPSEYDIVIIGTPVWAFTMSSPIRIYIFQNREHFKKVAFFCTHEGMFGKTLKNMEDLCGKKPIIAIDFNRKETTNEKHAQKVKKIIDKTKCII